MFDFLKKRKQRAPKHAFFDTWDEKDPWEASSLHFFKKSQKNAPEVSPDYAEVAPSWQPDFKEVSFPHLENSFQKQKETYKSKDLFSREQRFPSQAASVQAPQAQMPVASAMGAPSFQASPPFRKNLAAAAFPQQMPVPPQQAQAQPQQTSAQPHFTQEGTINPQQKLFERALGARPTRPLYDAPPAPPSGNYAEESLPPYSQNQAYGAAPSPPPSPRAERRTFSFDPSFLKVILSGTALLFCALLLWWVNERNKQDSSKEIPIILAPKNIKTRPEEPKTPLVPYQEELIYGKLDDEDEEQNGERLIPKTPFAPKLQESSENEEESDDYLHVPHENGEENSLEKEKAVTVEELAILKPKGKAPPPPKVEKREADELWEAETHVRHSTPQHHKKETPPPFSKAETKTEAKTDVKPAKDKEKNKEKTKEKPVFIQLGTLSTPQLARSEMAHFLSKYKSLSRYHFMIRPFRISTGRTVYRLVIGPFASETKALDVAQSLGISCKITH